MSNKDGVRRAGNPRFHEPGHQTAYGDTADYRLLKLSVRGLLEGDWLDLGCAEGAYAFGLLRSGARSVVGVDASSEAVERARAAAPDAPPVRFVRAEAESLPFADESFDGVLVNEVLEHVEDERATLAEVRRVLRPAGHLALFAPNRWFPFEGHGARWNELRALWPRPVPLMPWLPKRLTGRFATARNYWPGELRRLVEGEGFEVVESGWALALFEQYRWLPANLVSLYKAHLDAIERSPIARFAAVSTFILGRR